MMLLPGKTRDPPSPTWMAVVTLVVCVLYLAVWWIVTPSPVVTTDETPIFVSQERYLQQAESLVGRLVRINPLELRAQLQVVLDQLDQLDLAKASTSEAHRALTQEPRDLVAQYMELARQATLKMSDVVTLVSELKAEYHSHKAGIN